MWNNVFKGPGSSTIYMLFRAVFLNTLTQMESPPQKKKKKKRERERTYSKQI